MSDTVEVTPVNFAVTRRLVLFWGVGGEERGGGYLSWRCEGVYGLTVDIYPSGHTTPLLVSSWIPLISTAILSSIELRQHVFVTTLSPSLFFTLSLRSPPNPVINTNTG